MPYDEVPLNRYTSMILLFKVCLTAPFYFVALLEPHWIAPYTFLLFMEAFHHFHARIFFLLALYRCVLQLYFALFSSGYYQRRFMMLEVLFDCGLMSLYVHENFRLHNINVFVSKFLFWYTFNSILTLLSLRITKDMKVEHVV